MGEESLILPVVLPSHSCFTSKLDKKEHTEAILSWRSTSPCLESPAPRRVQLASARCLEPPRRRFPVWSAVEAGLALLELLDDCSVSNVRSRTDAKRRPSTHGGDMVTRASAASRMPVGRQRNTNAVTSTSYRRGSYTAVDLCAAA
jgi:hypothetical protein